MAKKPPYLRQSVDHSRDGVPDEFSDSARGIRLQKAIADAGIASRRDAEVMIREGRISVNKKRVNGLPAFVNPHEDNISLDGNPIHKIVNKKANERKVCIMLNKPKHTITTLDDPQGRQTVMDLVQYDNAPRLYPIGRLDAESTGLLLLTNDGDLSQQLTHPSYGVPKTYKVSIRGRLEETDINRLKRGLVLTHHGPRGAAKIKRAHATEVQLINYGRGGSGDRTTVSVTLREGQNREIRRLLAAIGFKVRRLERVSIGPLVLKGLASGEWRMLTEREVKQLRKAAAQAKVLTEAIAEGKALPKTVKPVKVVKKVTRAVKKGPSPVKDKPTRRGANKSNRKKTTTRKATAATTKKTTSRKVTSKKSAPRGKRRPK